MSRQKKSVRKTARVDSPKPIVTYERLPSMSGARFVPVIDEGDPPPGDEHYAEAARLEAQYQAEHGEDDGGDQTKIKPKSDVVKTAVQHALNALHAGNNVQRQSGPAISASPIADPEVRDIVRQASDRLYLLEMVVRGMSAQAKHSEVPSFELDMLEDEMSRISTALYELSGAR